MLEIITFTFEKAGTLYGVEEALAKYPWWNGGGNGDSTAQATATEEEEDLNPHSLLTPECSRLFFELTALVRFSARMVRFNRWEGMLPHFQKWVYEFIVEPADWCGLDLVFVLELLGRFERDMYDYALTHAFIPTGTMLKFYQGNFRDSNSPSLETDAADAMASHLRPVKDLPVNEAS